MLRKNAKFGLFAAAVGIVALTSIVFARARTERQDCPGKIVCPKTGQLVCRDRCSTVDPDRADCPGRVVCPLTGELVCADRCPLNKDEGDKGKAGPPSCCRSKG